jgi:hypothetical protein
MIGVYLSGFRASIQNNTSLEISHLFADDMLIMCDADRVQINILGHILISFEAISSLKVVFKNRYWSQWGMFCIKSRYSQLQHLLFPLNLFETSLGCFF